MILSMNKTEELTPKEEPILAGKIEISVKPLESSEIPKTTTNIDLEAVLKFKSFLQLDNGQRLL